MFNENINCTHHHYVHIIMLFVYTICDIITVINLRMLTMYGCTTVFKFMS